MIAHGQVDLQSPLQPTVEVDQVRVGIVEQCASRVETERNREAATERLHQPFSAMRLPQRPKVGNLPPFAAGPLERRSRRRRRISPSA